MTEEGPLGRTEEWVGFHVGRAGAGTDAADFVFYEEFADERLAEAGGIRSAIDLAGQNVGTYCDICGAPECSGNGTSSRRMLANV